MPRTIRSTRRPASQSGPVVAILVVRLTIFCVVAVLTVLLPARGLDLAVVATAVGVIITAATKAGTCLTCGSALLQ